MQVYGIVCSDYDTYFLLKNPESWMRLKFDQKLWSINHPKQVRWEGPTVETREQAVAFLERAINYIASRYGGTLAHQVLGLKKLELMTA